MVDVKPNGPHHAHQAGPRGQKPAELSVHVDAVAHHQEHLNGNQKHPDGEHCGVQMQKQRWVLAQETLGIEAEAEKHAYPKNANPDYGGDSIFAWTPVSTNVPLPTCDSLHG
jgi:hypothetical protein